MQEQRIPVIDRIYARIEVHPLGCWEWQGCVGDGGHGIVSLGGREDGRGKVHRVVYEHEVGPIPEGLVLDHLCMNPRCCNWAHVEPVTQAENARRMWAAGRGLSGHGRQNRLKTHCVRGHPFDEINTRVYGGKRHCHECRLNASRRYRARLAGLKRL